MSFKSDNWLVGADRRLLVSIALTDPESKRETNYPSNPTVYFCDIPDTSTGYFTYGGTVYQPTIQKFSGNSASIDFRGSASDADATLVLANIRYPFQFKHAVGAPESNQYNVKLSQLFADYLWSGATVTATCYCKVGATETTQQVFSGVVFDVSATVNAVTVRVIQDKAPIRPKPDAEGPGSSTFPSLVQKINYGGAPDSSIGMVLPIAYTGATWNPVIEAKGGLCVNPRNLLSMWNPVVTSARYDGTYLAQYVLSAYPTQTAPTTANAYLFQSLDELDTIAIGRSSTITWSGGVQELYASVSSEVEFEAYINPNDNVAAVTTGGVSNVGRAFDRTDLYATVTNSGATQTLALRIPNGSQHGRITACSVWMLLDSGGTTVGADADGTVYGTFGMWNAHTPGYHDGISKNVTKADCRDGGFLSTAFTSTTYNRSEWQSWQWHDTTLGGVPEDIYFTFALTKANSSANVVACGLKVRYLPQFIYRSPVNLFDIQGRKLRRLR